MKYIKELLSISFLSISLPIYSIYLIEKDGVLPIEMKLIIFFSIFTVTSFLGFISIKLGWFYDDKEKNMFISIKKHRKDLFIMPILFIVCSFAFLIPLLFFTGILSNLGLNPYLIAFFFIIVFVVLVSTMIFVLYSIDIERLRKK